MLRTFVRTLKVLSRTIDRTPVTFKIFNPLGARKFFYMKSRDIFFKVDSIALSVNNFRQNS